MFALRHVCDMSTPYVRTNPLKATPLHTDRRCRPLYST